MKTLASSLLIVCSFIIISCQEKIDVEREKQAIIAVIEEETNAFYDRDADRLAANHVQDETNTRLNVARGGYNVSTGWSDTTFNAFFEANPEPDGSYEEKSNFRIKVYPQSAWAMYDNKYFNSDGEHVNDGVHVQFLEKVNGEWKIVFMSIVNTGSFDRVNENYETAALYHELDPANVDAILTEDFIGKWDHNRHTWDRESHRNFLANNTTMEDSIYGQVADDNWVATHFVRTGTYQGNEVEVQAMQFKRFEDGKIAEIFEYFDPQQMEQ